jgi:hypothetical protein
MPAAGVTPRRQAQINYLLRIARARGKACRLCVASSSVIAMTYRISVRLSPDGRTVMLSQRDAALLCLADGDELVISQVVHNAHGQRGRPLTEVEAPPPAANDVAPALGRAAPDARPAPARPSEDEIEATKRVFRRLGR